MSTHNEVNGPVYGKVFQAHNLIYNEQPEQRSPIALYYPYIHVQDNLWLKYAALYWPRITRLVPNTYRTTDSSVAEAFVRAGVLSDLEPGHLEGHQWMFFRMVEERSDDLRARYSVRNLDRWPAQNRHAAAGEGADPRLIYLHPQKFDRFVFERLLASDLGVLHTADDGKWIGMHPDLANVYICQLVEFLARREWLHPVTDDPLAHDASLGWDLERMAEVLLDIPRRPRQRDATQQFVEAAVHTVVPEGLAGVPVEKILELRETFPKEFHRFRAHIGDRFTELKADRTTKLHIDVAVDELVRAELVELEDKLRSIKLVPRRVRVWLKADPERESPVGWLFRAGQALR
ncbi:DUF6236 family protein [Lentzea flaviverrucosa]|uniref:Uncharacterized protein n=1 Tax=Lentzea flaviverrucosa TaxID=200379 RepID=A0A1H9V1M8_9PSEU|nr:DUF6236 family protein [Lentzea flaviverrucosa]RDI27616.1 hypothetical protein DFR72_106100 [Lentzea flaviverrucosa]SES15193.1 hypothetical protein SAMN05216195_109245 [Lentzea flaviverrucosa]